MESKWDKLQTQLQQMEHVQWPLLVRLAYEMLLGIIGILEWGVGFIPQSAWVCLEKDENLLETIWANIVTYAKPFESCMGQRSELEIGVQKTQPSQRNGCNIQVS
jgi:hypothetical protein